MAALIDSEYELPILVGPCCPLRPREFLALRWRDEDLDAGVTGITQNVHGKDVHVPGSREVGEAPVAMAGRNRR